MLEGEPPPAYEPRWLGWHVGECPLDASDCANCGSFRMTEAVELERAGCGPASVHHAEVLSKVTDASTQCTGLVVLESDTPNQMRTPPAPARFVCTGCRQTVDVTFLTLARAEDEAEVGAEWTDLTRGGDTVPPTEPRVYSYVGDRKIRYCDGGGALAVCVAALGLLGVW